MWTRMKLVAGVAIAVAGAVAVSAHVAREAAVAREAVGVAARDRAAPRASSGGRAPAPALAPGVDAAGVLRAIAEARGLDREKLAQDAHWTLVRALRDDPDGTAAALAHYLASAGGREIGTRTAVGALVAVGTSALQDMLVAAVTARAGDADFVRLAVPSIGFFARPTAATEAALQTLADSGDPVARATARLAVGIMAGKLAADEPARASAIVDDYASRLAAAQTAGERAAYLDALGNAGTAAAGTAIAAQLGDSDPVVRKRAALALRRVDTGGAEAALLGTLADSDERVRESAAWSLAYRAPSPAALHAMLERLARESSVRVVSSLLDTVWARRATDPAAVVAVVRRLAREHPVDSIRARAAALQ